jgi:hypothetical protein
MAAKEAPMAYSDFRYPAVIADLGLTPGPSEDMFAGTPPRPAGAAVRHLLATTGRLAATINTEKARSEWMVAPVLGEFWSAYHARIGLYSGVEFPADPDAGLTGVVDFLITRAPQLPHIVAPVAVLFEAKRDNLNDGLGQAIAGMVGAQRFNRRERNGIEIVYGGVTTGSLWKFLRLDGTAVTLDLREYNLSEVDHLLGILTHIVGPVPEPAAA